MNNLGGVFIKSVTTDDFSNTCNCGAFAATQIITDVIDKKQVNELIDCTGYGKLPGES